MNFILWSVSVWSSEEKAENSKEPQTAKGCILSNMRKPKGSTKTPPQSFFHGDENVSTTGPHPKCLPIFVIAARFPNKSSDGNHPSVRWPPYYRACNFKLLTWTVSPISTFSNNVTNSFFAMRPHALASCHRCPSCSQMRILLTTCDIRLQSSPMEILQISSERFRRLISEPLHGYT